MSAAYCRHELVSLKQHPDFNEAWVRDRIEEDPTILGLGEVEVRDVERIQPQGGRLDLLLRDPETDRRYEVELQLGTTDETHIIRTIEYWDIERQRYPLHDHCAVIVAENITARFHNVISLFNRAIPLIAIQLNALKVGDKLLLHFTRVLDLVEPGDDDDGGDPKVVDRSYYEKRRPEGLRIVDRCHELLRGIDPELDLHYTRSHIGLSRSGIVDNFVAFWPRKQYALVQARVRDASEWVGKLESAGLTPVPNTQGQRIRLRLYGADLDAATELIQSIFRESYEYATGQ